MSRIGKKPIAIPEKTEILISDGLVTVKGPGGELSRKVHPLIKVEKVGEEVVVNPTKENIEARALWGTFASHIANMVSGVNKPFEKKLILEGIGFKSEVKPASTRDGDSTRLDSESKRARGGNNELHLALGFSHPVIMTIPEGLTVTAEKNNITISGIDKEAVGSFAAKVRAKKKPEPYKGKGMRYDGEVIRRKQGKKSV